ncbi:MAG: hypothetical protein LIV29_06275 [Denitrobacterium sp.]|jgi:hypothetical protein|nr:hypothetical protein [Denitrobacterium sp.]
MAMIRPSLILRMHVAESLATDEVKSSFNRAYSYIAPSMMEPSQPPYAGENTMEMLVRIHRAYWDSAAEGANGVWDDIMVPWLSNMFYKLSNNMVQCVRRAPGNGDAAVLFDWLDIEFEGLHVALKLGDDSSIPEGAIDMVEQVRAKANAGELGEGAVRVRIPSRASWEAQKAAALAAEGAAKQRDAEEAAKQGDAEGAAEGATQKAAAADSAAASPADDGVVSAAASSDEAAAAPADASAAPAAPSSFTVDYTTWGIECADGTVREIEA